MRRCRLGVVDIRSPCQTASCRGRGQLFTALSVTSRFQCGGQYYAAREEAMLTHHVLPLKASPTSHETRISTLEQR